MIGLNMIENRRLLTKIARMHYMEGLSQKEISARTGISRPQISRMIYKAKQEKIIDITIVDEFSNEHDLEKKLVEKYNLKYALVFNNHDKNGMEGIESFAEEAAKNILHIFPNSGTIGVMSGKTISLLVEYLNPVGNYDLNFIPLIGVEGNIGHKWHANTISQDIAKKFDSKYLVLNAPIIVSTKEGRDSLVEEQSIKEVLDAGKNCDLAIVGIGNVSNYSTTIEAEKLDSEQIEELRRLGIEATVASTFYDMEGNDVKTSLTDRTIGIGINDLTKATIVAVASGDSKVNAIKSTLNSGKIDILVTSLRTAERILELS